MTDSQIIGVVVLWFAGLVGAFSVYEDHTNGIFWLPLCLFTIITIIGLYLILL